MGQSCNSNKKEITFQMKTLTDEMQTFCKDDIRKFYVFGQILGTNSFGSVRMAKKILIQNPIQILGESRRKSSVIEFYVIKSIFKIKVMNLTSQITQELQSLCRLDHPNIVRFYEAFEDDIYMYFVMEYCQGGEFFTNQSRKEIISEKQAAVVMKKLFSACAYMHSKGIAHRDLRTENVRLDSQGEVKIINFGLSKKFNEKDLLNQMDMMQSIVSGAISYRAPEVFSQSYNVECDNWSLGVILFFMLSGTLPFGKKDMTDQDLINAIKYKEPFFDVKQWKDISDEAKQLIKRLLEKNPHKRITSDEALSSCWIRIHTDQHQLQKIDFYTHKVDIITEATPISDRTIGLLKIYANHKKIKKEVLKLFVNQMDEQDLNKLKSKFYEMDTNHNGSISLEELKQVMKRVGHKATQDQILQLIKSIHQDNTISGSHELFIDYTEFLAANLDSKIYLNSENLWNLFKYFDVKDQNYLQIQDLDESFKKTGRQLSKKQLKQLFNEIDLDKHGKVDFYDFCRVMIANLKQKDFPKYYQENYASPDKPLLNH